MTSRADLRPGNRLWLALAAGALLLGATGAALRAEDMGTAREAMARAADYRARGDNRAARIELMNAIKAAPKMKEARLAQARGFRARVDADGAEGERQRDDGDRGRDPRTGAAGVA